MTPARVEETDEVRRLQDCLNDLISVMALPAIWSGRGPAQILGTLLEAVLRMLRLEFAYARLTPAFDGDPAEVIRTSSRLDNGIPVAVAGEHLMGLLRRNSSTRPVQAASPVAERDVRIAFFPLGLLDGIGVLIVGSERADFPTKTEGLVLQVAANQAAVGLQDMWRLAEQRRAAHALEERVEERTAESRALKDELAAELAEMRQLHHLSTRMQGRTELMLLLGAVLDVTMALQHADFGTVRVSNAETRTHDLVVQRGFGAEYCERFRSVPRESLVYCDELERGERVVIEDIKTDPRMARWRSVAAEAGFRASQTTPLLSVRGDMMGVMSTYFRVPHRPSERELRFTDLYARQAADLIARRRALYELQRSEAYLAEGEKITHTGSWSVNARSGEVWWSLGHYRIWGLDPATKVTQDMLRAMIHVDDRAQVWEQYERALRDRAVLDCEFRVVRPDGVVKHCHSIGHPVFDEAGTMIEFVGTVRDITERRAAEVALGNARAELAHVTRATTMGMLTASIAHEVNQPLAAIVTNANACVHWLAAKDLKEAQAAAKRIIRDANRASEVIVHIRAFLTRGKPLETELRIEKVIAGVVGVVKGESRAKGVNLEVDVTPGLPAFMGDRIQLQQVLLNLIMNAIEAMAAVTDRPRHVKISAHPHNRDELCVSVRDSGPGLDPAELERVFDMFYTTKAQGMGMGLSISRTIIESHGGRLWATRNDTGGETFQFTLPVKGAKDE